MPLRFRTLSSVLVASALLPLSAACSAVPDAPGSDERGLDSSDGPVGSGNIKPNADPTALAAALQGAGAAVTVTGAKYTGAAGAVGTFTEGPLGISDGVILTTGSAAFAAAPSDSGSKSKSNGRAGSPRCDELMKSGKSYDAASLSLTFDLADGFDGISLLSIFGSEEYKEYVGSAYNDVYGVYLNGKQVAFDAKGAPITINGPFFSSSEVVVAPNTETEYDGSTGLLQTKAPLAGGSKGNVLEIVTCDGGDAYYDSGVLVAALNGCVGDDCSGTKPCEAVDDDGDGATSCDDCDDTDPLVSPGSAERCNERDDNCDGTVDEGAACHPVTPIGSPITVCAGVNHPPTIAAGGGRFAVGCMPEGLQEETPVVKIVGDGGTIVGSHMLRTSNGYYYGDIQLSHHDGRFQVLNVYNCDDDGNWQVGWGWGCNDFRELSEAGTLVTPSVVFGEPGNNSHPGMSFSGAEHGVAWVSYSDVYFRRIGPGGKLVDGDPGANQLVFKTTYDDREASRTHIAWDGAGYGIFSILHNKLHFARVGATGAVVTPKIVLGSAYSQTFGGQFTTIYEAGAYWVLYREGSFAANPPVKINLMKVGLDGAVLAQTNVVTTNGDPRFPQMILKDGLFYVFTQDEELQGIVTVVDMSGNIVAAKSGVFSFGPMFAPTPAFDPTTGDLAVAYVDAQFWGAVKLQRLSDAP